MTTLPQLDQNSEVPLYRQLYESIRMDILNGSLPKGVRLPPTRELAGSLGLNRTTVSAAYELLENAGLIRGHVGRGSFVADVARAADEPTAPVESSISFATSRPLEELFPLDEFRATVGEVIGDSSVTSLLQLGSPQGYAPLRRYLSGTGSSGKVGGVEDVLITSGCQQALDLIQRVLSPVGSTVLVDDPMYPGLKNVFESAGVRLAALPGAGVDAEFAIVTPNFQNPTGYTMTLDERQRLLRYARDRGITIVEIDLYSQLRYRGQPLPSLAELDPSAAVIQIGSFSKIAFPGLRIGWVKARREIIARLTEAKQRTDLHSDQLSQAVLLRFAESGRLEAHRSRVVAYGAGQLDAAVEALDREMPAGTVFTRPEGGMNLWVTLPAPLDASVLLADAQRAGVSYLPGRFFTISRHDAGSFRLSFGGLTPERITHGIELLGRVFHQKSPVDALATAMV